MAISWGSLRFAQRWQEIATPLRARNDRSRWQTAPLLYMVKFQWNIRFPQGDPLREFCICDVKSCIHVDFVDRCPCVEYNKSS